jgi:hypothetical protein
MVYQTPSGSYLMMDDKTGNVQLTFKHGESSVIMGENLIQMELSKGDNSGKASHTSLSLSKGSFMIKTPDSTFKFDESGLSIGNDDNGSFMKITKGGIEFHGEEFFKITSKESVSIMGKEVTIEGTKDASIRANHLRLSGTQLTSIKGSQIELEGIATVQLKAFHIGLQASTKLTEATPLKQSTIIGTHVKNVGVYTEKSSLHAIKTGNFALKGGQISMDGSVVTNNGVASKIAPATFNGADASASAVHTALTTLSTAMLIKEPGTSATNQILTDSLAGAAKPAQESTGFAGNAKDKKDNKSNASVAATRYIDANTIMEKFSYVPTIVSMGQTTI